MSDTGRTAARCGVCGNGPCQGGNTTGEGACPKWTVADTGRTPDGVQVIRSALSWCEETPNGERHREKALAALERIVAERDEARRREVALREAARLATSLSAAPDYDEEAIRLALWAVVGLVLTGVDGDARAFSAYCAECYREQTPEGQWKACSCDRTYHDECPDHGVHGAGLGPSGKRSPPETTE